MKNELILLYLLDLEKTITSNTIVKSFSRAIEKRFSAEPRNKVIIYIPTKVRNSRVKLITILLSTLKNSLYKVCLEKIDLLIMQ